MKISIAIFFLPRANFHFCGIQELYFSSERKAWCGVSFCFEAHPKEGCGTCSFTVSPQCHVCSLTSQRLITVTLNEPSCLVPGLILITILCLWIEEMREERLACLLPVKHTQKQQFTQKPSLCFLCCQARQQMLDLEDFIVCLGKNSSFSVWGAIT